jgi:hypothetical protein
MRRHGILAPRGAKGAAATAPASPSAA